MGVASRIANDEIGRRRCVRTARIDARIERRNRDAYIMQIMAPERLTSENQTNSLWSLGSADRDAMTAIESALDFRDLAARRPGVA